MRKIPCLLSILALISFSGCDSDNSLVVGNYSDKTPETGDNAHEPDSCDRCSIDRKCSGSNAYMLCRDGDGDGCREWIRTPCQSDEECENGFCINLTAPCNNACDMDQCDASGRLIKCTDTNDDGCREIMPPESCPDGKKCEGGSCVIPQPACSNECPNDGDKICDGNALKTCSDSNGDGCLEWNSQTCGYQCDGSKCIEDPLAWVPQCITDPCPIPITDFSQTLTGNTKTNGKNTISKYTSCIGFNRAEPSDESGPEEYYVVNITEPGYLIVGITHGSKVNIDAQILTAPQADKCIAHGMNYEQDGYNMDGGVGAHVDKGIYYITADTAGGDAKAGEYTMKVTFIADNSKCGMLQETFKRHKTCNCHEACDVYDEFPMPVTASTAQEAHLVTDYQRQKYGDSWWPSSTKDSSLTEHKARTDELFGDGTAYGNEYCPSEGGHIGSGSTGNSVPEKAEAWYFNMYWAKSYRPARGTKYLIVNPKTGQTVVGAGGYETGPGSCDRMGGAVYEVQHYLGTKHGSTLTFGKLNNQDLDFGPVDCNE